VLLILGVAAGWFGYKHCQMVIGDDKAFLVQCGCGYGTRPQIPNAAGDLCHSQLVSKRQPVRATSQQHTWKPVITTVLTSMLLISTLAE
jgi:hypothetical protein